MKERGWGRERDRKIERKMVEIKTERVGVIKRKERERQRVGGRERDKKGKRDSY